MPRFRQTILATCMLAALPCAFAAESDAGRVVARRGGAELTLGEVDGRMYEIPAQHRALFIDNPQRIEKMLRDLLLVEQLANEAEAEGLDKDPALAARIELERKRILAGKRLEQLSVQEQVGDLEAIARETYQSRKADFVVPGGRDVRHILVKTDCRSSDEARKLAESYRKRALKGDEKFEQLARDLSEDEGSRAYGGLIPVSPGKTVAAFEKAAYALKEPGDISPVVETEYGFHVMKLESMAEGRTIPYEEARAGLIDKIGAERRANSVRAHTDELQNLPIDADAEAIASLRTRYGDAAAGPAAAPAAAEKTPEG